jgi:hypothetical protein
MVRSVLSVSTMHQVHERARKQQEKRQRPQDMPRMRPQQPAADGSKDEADHEPRRRSQKSPKCHVRPLQVSTAFAAYGATSLPVQPTLTSVIMPVAM